MNADYEGDVKPENMEKLTHDETKYLGGDEKTTHLVKGLDFALLNRVRESIKHKERDEQDVQPTAVPQKAAEPTNIETAFQPTAKKSSPPAVPHAGAAASSRSAPLARAVEQLVARERASSSSPLPTTT